MFNIALTGSVTLNDVAVIGASAVLAYGFITIAEFGWHLLRHSIIQCERPRVADEMRQEIARAAQRPRYVITTPGELTYHQSRVASAFGDVFRCWQQLKDTSWPELIHFWEEQVAAHQTDDPNARRFQRTFPEDVLVEADLQPIKAQFIADVGKLREAAHALSDLLPTIDLT